MWLKLVCCQARYFSNSRLPRGSSILKPCASCQTRFGQVHLASTPRDHVTFSHTLSGFTITRTPHLGALTRATPPNSPNYERSPNHSQRVSHRGSRHQGALSNRSQQQRPFLPRARQRRNGSAPVASSARRLVVIMGKLKLDALLLCCPALSGAARATPIKHPDAPVGATTFCTHQQTVGTVAIDSPRQNSDPCLPCLSLPCLALCEAVCARPGAPQPGATC